MDVRHRLCWGQRETTGGRTFGKTTLTPRAPVYLTVYGRAPSLYGGPMLIAAMPKMPSVGEMHQSTLDITTNMPLFYSAPSQ